MPTPTNVQKAYLQVEGGAKIPCWFNPKEYAVSRTNNWKVDPVTGSGLPTAQFTGSQPHELKIDLLFDDSEAPDGSVEKICGELLKMMEPADKFASSSKNSARPPMVEFGWGAGLTPAFNAVCKSLQIKYSLFRTDGVPIRANVSLSLTQVEKAVGGAQQGNTQRQNPTTTGVAGLRSHVVREGDSLHSIAYAAYGDSTKWRRIAEANSIDDPTALKRGTILTIPRLSE